MSEKNINLPKAIIVDVIPPEMTKEDGYKRLRELESLVTTFGGVVIVKKIQKRGDPDYDTYLGKGKVEEIVNIAQELGADLLIVNNILKAKQVYNLDEYFREAKLNMKTWDRIELILEIFSRHATSTEAKLQIELSRIRHMGPRIFGLGGDELSKQGGVMGLRGGQGESNIEIMKRHLRRQEMKIMDKLKHYELIRQGHRDRRKKKNLKTVALVGYTNAGKSSLLRALTNKDTYIADELFATLDTRVGKLYLQHTEGLVDGRFVPGKELLISDTIGFIQDLPPDLIQAFKSTLSETVEADLILHVIDVTDPELEMKIRVVEEILMQIGAGSTPKIYVFNKVDLLEYENHEVMPALHEVRPKGIVKAGSDAARELGWTIKEKREKFEELIHRHNLLQLRDNHRRYNPLFLSAQEKINLEELIHKLSDSL